MQFGRVELFSLYSTERHRSMTILLKIYVEYEITA